MLWLLTDSCYGELEHVPFLRGHALEVIDWRMFLSEPVPISPEHALKLKTAGSQARLSATGFRAETTGER
jgi:hypothetical protein